MLWYPWLTWWLRWWSWCAELCRIDFRRTGPSAEWSDVTDVFLLKCWCGDRRPPAGSLTMEILCVLGGWSVAALSMVKFVTASSGTLSSLVMSLFAFTYFVAVRAGNDNISQFGLFGARHVPCVVGQIQDQCWLAISYHIDDLRAARVSPYGTW